MRTHVRPAVLAGILTLLAALLLAAPAYAVDPPPVGGVTLNAVQFLDDQNGFAAGGFNAAGTDYGFIARTTNGGASWTRRVVNVPAHYLTSISFPTNGTVGYAVDGFTSNKIFKTADAGVTWSAMFVPSSVAEYGVAFDSVWFSDDLNGYAAGSNTGKKEPAIWRTTNGGVSWTKDFVAPLYEDSEGQPIGEGEFYSVTGYDATHLLTVGSEVQKGGAIGYRSNTTTWVEDPMPADTPKLLAASYSGANTALAVGESGKAARLGVSGWTAQSTGVTSHLRDVELVDGTHGWAVGDSGVIRFWNGTAFSPQTAGTMNSLRGVDFTSAVNGWVVGQNEIILKTTNGGLTWSPASPPPGGSGPVVTELVQGGDRYATAIAAVQKAFPDGSQTVVIAYGMNFPDALGASALCGAYNSPLLLTQTGYIPAPVRDEIKRLKATKAVIIGSEAVVSKAVAADLQSLTGSAPVRIAGGDRYATASLVAREVPAALSAPGADDVFVAVGDNFPDALAASPAAYYKKWPILLTQRTGLPASTVSALQALKPKRVHILGSTGAVPAGVEAQLRSLLPAATVDRWQGGNRYATAVDIANRSGLSYDGVALATGENFPDALAGGVMQGRFGSVVLLTPTSALSADTRAALLAHKPQISTVRYLGSTAAVSQAVRNAVADLLK